MLAHMCATLSILALVMAASGISPRPVSMQKGVLDSVHMTTLENRIAHGLTMLSEKNEEKILEGQVELRSQPTRKS